MPFEPTPGEWILLALMAVGAVLGLFRGLSGGLGTLAGLSAGIAAAWFVLTPLTAFLGAQGWFVEGMVLRVGSLVCDGVIGLVVFGAVRRLVEKFVRVMVPRVLDALLGAAAGAGMGFALFRAGAWGLAFFFGDASV